MVDKTNKCVWIGVAAGALTVVYFVFFYKPAVSVSDPQSVMTFFSACITAYAIIIGLSNIYYRLYEEYVGMGFIKECLIIFSFLFFSIFIVVLFVPPTPFESVMWIARILFLAAVAVTIYITWQIPTK